MGKKQESTGKGIKLLVVDDDKKFLDVIGDRFALKEFDVATAVEGSEALELAREKMFDVAVVDLQMPGIDGKELLRILKEKHKFIEVIILTGFATIESAVACTKMGAFGYLEKPYNFEALVEKIQEAYTASLKKRFEADEQRMKKIQKISMRSSPMEILKELAALDED